MNPFDVEIPPPINKFYVDKVLDFHNSFEPVHHFLAFVSGYSLLKYDFGENTLKPKEKRILRLLFCPSFSTINLTTKTHRFMLRSINELYFNYYIASPSKIKDMFLEKLMLAAIFNFNDNSKDKFNQVKIKIENTGETHYHSLRIMLFSKKLRSLFNFVPTGNIEALGGLMNYGDVPSAPSPKNVCKPEKIGRFFKHWKKRFYIWGACDTLGIVDGIGCFHLFFTSKAHFRFVKFIPWIILLFMLSYMFLPMGNIMSFIYNSMICKFLIIVAPLIAFLKKIEDSFGIIELFHKAGSFLFKVLK